MLIWKTTFSITNIHKLWIRHKTKFLWAVRGNLLSYLWLANCCCLNVELQCPGLLQFAGRSNGYRNLLSDRIMSFATLMLSCSSQASTASHFICFLPLWAMAPMPLFSLLPINCAWMGLLLSNITLYVSMMLMEVNKIMPASGWMDQPCLQCVVFWLAGIRKQGEGVLR